MVSELSDSSLANRYVTKSVHFVPQNYEEYGDFMEAHMVEIDGYFHMPWPIVGGFEYLVLIEESQPAVETTFSSSVEFEPRSVSAAPAKPIDPKVKIKLQVPRVELLLSHVGAHEGLAETPTKHGTLVENILFDPGIEKVVGYIHDMLPEVEMDFAQEMLDEMAEPRTWLCGSPAHIFDPGIENETINLAIGLDYFVNEGVIDLKHEGFIMSFDYVVEKEALSIGGNEIEWRIAWVMESN